MSPIRRSWHVFFGRQESAAFRPAPSQSTSSSSVSRSSFDLSCFGASKNFWTVSEARRTRDKWSDKPPTTFPNTKFWSVIHTPSLAEASSSCEDSAVVTFQEGGKQ